MSTEYVITYKAENLYEGPVHKAHWQFLIIPEQNTTQDLVSIDFKNSINAYDERSVNGFGFRSIRIRPKKEFDQIRFEASFKLIKHQTNPFELDSGLTPSEEYEKINTLDFKVDFEPFLRFTHFTSLPDNSQDLFKFRRDISIFENLQALNTWIFKAIKYSSEVTDVQTTLEQIIEHRQGVCQDFAHLFCALSRKNNIPTRYISGYLHQGNGYFGDAQMHAWIEAYIPNMDWVGFDPTNNILVSDNHIKVAHGKDYDDCAPLKGVVYASGDNETTHSVEVLSQEQQ